MSAQTELVRLLGMEEILKNMKGFPVKLQNRIMATGLRAGGRVIMADIARRAPKKRGNLAKTIRQRKAPRRLSRGGISMVIGVGARYAHLVEFGTAPHVITPRAFKDRMSSALRVIRSGGSSEDAQALLIRGRFVGGTVHHPGAAPHPFVRPAFEARAHEAIRVITRKMAKKMERDKRKLSRGNQ